MLKIKKNTVFFTSGGLGYGGAVDSEEKFFARLESIMENIEKTSFIGWCYTQLTDVEQETNGLLDADHVPKFSDEKMANKFNQ